MISRERVKIRATKSPPNTHVNHPIWKRSALSIFLNEELKYLLIAALLNFLSLD